MIESVKGHASYVAGVLEAVTFDHWGRRPMPFRAGEDVRGVWLRESDWQKVEGLLRDLVDECEPGDAPFVLRLSIRARDLIGEG